MEIKVQCDCGQKFKFDVEPVNGHVPFAVKCPVCGFDGTPRANVVLQQLLASTPPPSTTAPAPISIAAAAPALAPAYTPPPPAPAPMRPAGLSINRPPQPQAAPAADDDEDIEGKETEDADSDNDTEDTKLGWKMWCWIILFILLIIGGSYLKSARKSLVGDVLDWGWNKVTGASSQSADNSTSEYPNVLHHDSGTALLIKHPNQDEVVQACSEFWQERFKQKLYSMPSKMDETPGEGFLYVLLPPVKGWVEINGAPDWDEKETETLTAMSEFISKKFATMVVCALIGDDAEFGTVMIYENGDKKFSVVHTIRIARGEVKDMYRVTGESWASGLGFKPEVQGFKEFNMDDASRLVRHIGFESKAQETPTNCINLGTSPAKP
jgi:hypothetical protein